MNGDDLLSFKEYSPVHENHLLSGHAEININSPTRQSNSGHSAASTPNDPLQDLMNSIGNSVNVLHNEDRNMQINSAGKMGQMHYYYLLTARMCHNLKYICYDLQDQRRQRNG